MRNILTLIGWGLAILFCTLFLLKCNNNVTTKLEYKNPKDSTKITIVDTTHKKPILIYKDSFIKGDTKYIKGETIYQKGDTVYIPVKSMYLTTGDTLAIVNDYYLKKIFKGTFSVDSVNVTWYDSVSQNRSLGHKFVIQNLRPTLQIPTVNTHKRVLYFGGSLGWSLNSRLPSLAPTMVYTDKQERGFVLSYDLINRTTQIGIVAKLHF